MPSISATAWANVTSFRAASVIDAPSAAKARAIAKPIPLLPPVIKATLFVNLPMPFPAVSIPFGCVFFRLIGLRIPVNAQ
jgi:hypothetical protein